MALANDAGYSFLLQCMIKMKHKDLIMHIIITEHEQRTGEKKNVLPVGDVKDQGKKKKKKTGTCWCSSAVESSTQFTTERSHHLPGNLVKNVHIQSLQEQWLCTKHKPACIGSHCYVNPETDEHILLSHERFDCWASAIVCISWLGPFQRIDER
jgi:hypothetical protein